MLGQSPFDPFSSPDQAKEHFSKGRGAKAKGFFDIALTEFRRAVVADPEMAEAWFEIGELCKDRADANKMFTRYSYEAYQKAARLDPKNQQAHDQYIISAQRMGCLEEVNEEYRALSKKFPDDALIQRCFNNSTNLLMAMMPDRVDFGTSENVKKMKALIFAASIGLILFGFGFAFFGPLIAAKFLKTTLNPGQLSSFMKGGISMIVLGIIGVVMRSRI